MMGSLESWLLLRSLRTLHLRVPRQSDNATELARWLNQAAGVRLLYVIPQPIVDTHIHRAKNVMEYLQA